MTRGDGAPIGATVTKGASRRAVRRLCGRRVRFRSGIPSRDVSELLAGWLVVAFAGPGPDAARVRDLLVTPAGAGPIHTNGATGSRPLGGSNDACILSYRNAVKRQEE